MCVIQSVDILLMKKYDCQSDKREISIENCIFCTMVLFNLASYYFLSKSYFTQKVMRSIIDQPDNELYNSRSLSIFAWRKWINR